LSEGLFQDTLKAVPDRACALLIGDLQEDLRTEMARDFQRLGLSGAVPDRIAAHLLVGKGVTVHLQAFMKDPEGANDLVKTVEALKKKAVEGLKNAKKPFQPKPETVNLLTKTIDGIRAETARQVVKIELEVAPDVVKAIHEYFEAMLKMNYEAPAKQ
jgi:hypothetical protein